MHLKTMILCFALLCHNSVSGLHAQWVPAGGLAEKNVLGLASSGTSVFAVTDKNLYRSTDGGTSWSLLNVTSNQVTTIAANGGSVFAGTSEGLCRSTDGGASWISLGSVHDNRVDVIVPFGGTNLIEAHGGSLYRSTDNGDSWIQAKNGPAYYNLTSVSANGDKALAGSDEGGVVYRSVDSGATWMRIVLPGVKDAVVNVAAFETVLFAAKSAGGLFRSTDNGVTWALSAAGLPSDLGGSGWLAYKPMLAFAGEGTTILAASEDGVFVSTDRGDIWINAYQNFRFVVNSLTILGSTVFAGTEGGGVWRRPLSEIVSSAPEKSEAVPASFDLYQNYPNPFNPVTRIHYTVGGAWGWRLGTSKVRLTVNDIVGRKVAVLIDEQKPPGSYEVTFDGSGLASGMYLYRLTAGLPDGQATSVVRSRIMLLVK